DTNAVAQIVAQNYVESGKKDVQQKVGQRAKARRRRGGKHYTVVDVAVDNKLAGGVALIGFGDSLCPSGERGGSFLRNGPSAGCHRRSHQERSAVGAFTRTWLFP